MINQGVFANDHPFRINFTNQARKKCKNVVNIAVDIPTAIGSHFRVDHFYLVSRHCPSLSIKKIEEQK